MLAVLQNGVELVSAGIVEGVAECTFRRPGTVNKTVSNNPTSFDLGSTQFFLLQAIGRLSLGKYLFCVKQTTVCVLTAMRLLKRILLFQSVGL